MQRHFTVTPFRILGERRLLAATVGPRESGNAPPESDPLPQVESERRVEEIEEGINTEERRGSRAHLLEEVDDTPVTKERFAAAQAYLASLQTYPNITGDDLLPYVIDRRGRPTTDEFHNQFSDPYEIDWDRFARDTYPNNNELPVDSDEASAGQVENQVEDTVSPTELQNLRTAVEAGTIPTVPTDAETQEKATPATITQNTDAQTADQTSGSSEKNNEKGDFIKELIRFVFEFMQSVTEGRLNLSDFAQRKSVERAARDIEQQIAQIDLALAGDGLTPEQIRVLQNRRTELDEQGALLKAQSVTIRQAERAEAATQAQQKAPEANPNNPSAAALEFIARYEEMNNRGELNTQEVADGIALLLNGGEQGEIQAFFDGMNFALRRQQAESGGSLPSSDRRNIRELAQLTNSALEARGNSTDRIRFQNGVLQLQKVESATAAENPVSRRRQRRRGSSPERRTAERPTERVPTPSTEGARILMSLGINMRPEVQDNMVDVVLRAGGRVDTGEIDDVVSQLTGDFSSAQSVIQALNTAIADFSVSDREIQRAADSLNSRLQGADFRIGTGPRVNGQSVLVIERGPGIQR